MRQLPSIALVVLLAGCWERQRPPGDEPGFASDGASEGEASRERLLRIENTRDEDAVTDEDIAAHDPAMRRGAVRSLARLGSVPKIPLLLRALADEDPDVEAWAAYGLGYTSRLDGAPTNDIARALIARSLHGNAPRGPLAPDFAISRALGRSATDEAERTLVAWLDGPRPRAQNAALALGDIASRKKTLSEPTELALLAAAAGGATAAPLGEALYPFGRLDHPVTSIGERLFEVARARLPEAGPTRMFAIRALSRAEKAGARELGQVLSAATAYDPAERAEAARGLGRLGPAGQRALAAALPALVPGKDPLALTALATSLSTPLFAALESLAGPLPTDVPRSVRALLYELATLAPPPAAPASLVRRVTKLRCRAASLLVNGAADDPLLVSCDPDREGEIGQRAALEVLGRRPIRGKRLTQWRALLGSKHLRVREAAIELLAGHAEMEDAPSHIARMLESAEPGIVTVTAELLGQHPDRAGKGDVVAKALGAALEHAWAPDEIETVGALAEAASAIRFAEAVPKLEVLCQDPNPTLRAHAARALTSLKNSKIGCASPAKATPAPELAHLVPAPVRLDLETDAGALVITLDPALAPVAVTRFVDLARAGFYRGIAAHRVVPGFVVQFGDPGGDGFGGPGTDPLRCETSPVPFEALDVGVALAGRDTGSSQLFVTLGRYPHLDGEYALVGKATGDWSAVAEGDVIRDVRVSP